jgi:hypothetical protein
MNTRNGFGRMAQWRACHHTNAGKWEQLWGVFVCTFAEHIMFDRPLEFSQDDITRGARNHIAFTLINERQPIELD